MDEIDDREQLSRSVELVKARIEKRHQLEQERANSQAARLLSGGRSAREDKGSKQGKPRRYRHDERRRAGFARGGFMEWCFSMFYKTLLFSLASATAVALIIGLRMLANKYGIHWAGDL